MRRHLEANSALGSLFEGVLAARPSGELLARLSLGKLSADLPYIGDRAYFQKALHTDQLVISEPLEAKRVNTPVVIMAISVRSRGGEVLGVLTGALMLSSNSLFSEAVCSTSLLNWKRSLRGAWRSCQGARQTSSRRSPPWRFPRCRRVACRAPAPKRQAPCLKAGAFLEG